MSILTLERARSRDLCIQHECRPEYEPVEEEKRRKYYFMSLRYSWLFAIHRPNHLQFMQIARVSKEVVLSEQSPIFCCRPSSRPPVLRFPLLLIPQSRSNESERIATHFAGKIARRPFTDDDFVMSHLGNSIRCGNAEEEPKNKNEKLRNEGERKAPRINEITNARETRVHTDRYRWMCGE